MAARTCRERPPAQYQQLIASCAHACAARWLGVQIFRLRLPSDLSPWRCSATKTSGEQRMKKIVLLLALAGFKAIAADANAQQTNVWSDIDCGQSKLVVPAGMKCHASPEFSGGTAAAAARAGGIFWRCSPVR